MPISKPSTPRSKRSRSGPAATATERGSERPSCFTAATSSYTLSSHRPTRNPEARTAVYAGGAGAGFPVKNQVAILLKYKLEVAIPGGHLRENLITHRLLLRRTTVPCLAHFSHEPGARRWGLLPQAPLRLVHLEEFLLPQGTVVAQSNEGRTDGAPGARQPSKERGLHAVEAVIEDDLVAGAAADPHHREL